MQLSRFPSPRRDLSRSLAVLGLLGAVVVGCSLDDTLTLRTTQVVAGAGGNSSTVGGNSGSPPEVRPSPFCSFKWGRSWTGTSTEVQSQGKPAYPNNLGMMSIWFGYEADDRLNAAVTKMLTTLSASGDPGFFGVTPVFYGYFIPFKSSLWDGISKDCAPSSATPNICTTGAAWIRSNRDKLRATYATYADQVAAVWGTEAPLIWLFEPGFNEYARASQTEPLTLEELSAVATDLVSTIKLHLPNARISHYASPAIEDLEAYFGALDLTYVDLVNVTGQAGLDYFAAGNNAANPSATYRRLHAASGRSILVDTGFGASALAPPDWLSVGADTISQRISDGVMAVQIDDAPSSMQSDIDLLMPGLPALDCE